MIIWITHGITWQKIYKIQNFTFSKATSKPIKNIFRIQRSSRNPSVMNLEPKSSFEHKKSWKLRKNDHFLQIFAFQNAKVGRTVVGRSGLSQILAKMFFYVIKPKIDDFIPKLRPPPKKIPPFFLRGGEVVFHGMSWNYFGDKLFSVLEY